MLYRIQLRTIDFVNEFRRDQGRYLRLYRAWFDLNQEEAAAAFGVSKLTWLKWENGQAEMKVATLAKFYEAWNNCFPEVQEEVAA